MPTAPYNTKCQQLGCKNPRSKLNSHCTDHGGKEYVSRETNSVYSTPAWKSIRQTQLSKQPLCQACLIDGRVEQAEHVDHVFPWTQIGKHSFMRNIFQSLCHSCHSIKTNKEKKGVFEYYQTSGIIRLLSKNDYSTMMIEMNGKGLET